MIIGTLKEIKNNEYRVGLTPDAIQILAEHNHIILVESGAGIGSGLSDADFRQAGAMIVYDRQNIWLSSNIIVKVKEPLPEEWPFLVKGWPLFNRNPIMFTFFHFPANPELKEIVLRHSVNALPYENIQLGDGSRPILKAMSKIAAEVSVDAGAHYLRKENGGKGLLLKDATAVVIGCEGSLGKTAFQLLVNRGAYVIGYDRLECIGRVPRSFSEVAGIEVKSDGSAKRYEKRIYCPADLTQTLRKSDLVICAAAAKGESAPKLITREMLKLMEPGSVIVDPAIDEGGCCETSRPTTHDNPIFIEEGIIHYCVANMPGAVPHSSTPALVKETLPFILEIADKGWEKALKENEILAKAAMIG